MIAIKKIKHDTKIIIISVLVLTILTLGVSYSAFFEVKNQKTVHEFSTGELNVIIDNTKMNSEALLPTPETDLPKKENDVLYGGKDTDHATLTLNNTTGDYDVDFSVTIGYDDIPEGVEGERLELKYLNLGIYDETNNKWVDFDSSEIGKSYYIPITSLMPSEENVYPILRDVVNKNESRSYKIYVWLSEEVPSSEIGKLIYLKLNVRSTTVEGQVEENGQPDVSKVAS